ncbi:MAG: hypothetical protein NTY66_03275, partial [Candidatus Vogelbacteria bacterium]|nr:hypothetical protein [Candidatus Vogelbacteria bacterium]
LLHRFCLFGRFCHSFSEVFVKFAKKNAILIIINDFLYFQDFIIVNYTANRTGDKWLYNKCQTSSRAQASGS